MPDRSVTNAPPGPVDVAADFDEFVAAADHSLVVVTTAVDGHWAGCLVGFHSQTSIDPLRYGVWVSVDNHTHEVITAAAGCAVHLLARDDREVAERFGGESGDWSEKFADVVVNEVEAAPGLAVPVISGTAAMVGRLVDCFHGDGDHTLVVVAPGSFHGRMPDRVLRLHDGADIDPGHPRSVRPSWRSGF